MNNIIIITNIIFNDNQKSQITTKLYFFNPWGFSKKGIENQIEELIAGVHVEPEDKIYFCIKDLFFGNRSRIAFTKAQKIFSNRVIERINPSALQLLLNKPSI